MKFTQTFSILFALELLRQNNLKEKGRPRLKFFLPGIVAVLICSGALAQTNTPFKKHQVIIIGDSLKIEVLKCRGEGENQECDVIYYTTIRQQGKRKWEKATQILALEAEFEILVKQRKEAAILASRPAKKINKPVKKDLQKNKHLTATIPAEKNPQRTVKPVQSPEKISVIAKTKVSEQGNTAQQVVKPVVPAIKTDPVDTRKNEKKTGPDTSASRVAEKATSMSNGKATVNNISAGKDTATLTGKTKVALIREKNAPLIAPKIAVKTGEKNTATKSVNLDTLRQKTTTPIAANKNGSSKKSVAADGKANTLVQSRVQDSVLINQPVKTVTGTASSKATPLLSLEDCYKLALDSNINLQIATNNLRMGNVDRSVAQHSYLPSATFNMGHFLSFGKNIDPVTNVFIQENFSGGYTAAGLQMDLFTGFYRLNRIKQSASTIRAADYSRKRTELELLTNVTLSYARLLLAKELSLFQQNSIINIGKEIDIIKEKIKVGKLSKYEFYTFNARLHSEEAELIKTQNDSVAALQDLRMLLNLNHQSHFTVATPDTNLLLQLNSISFSTGQLIDTIIQRHPAIMQAQSYEDAARLEEKLIKSNSYPSLSVGANVVSNYNIGQQDVNGSKIPFSDQLNNNLGQNINVNLRIPLFSKLENAGRVKKQQITISNAQLAQKEAINIITTNTIQLVNDFTTAKARYQATKVAYEQNMYSYELYAERYKLGQISSVELLTSREILNLSLSKFLQAKLQLIFQYKLLELVQRY